MCHYNPKPDNIYQIKSWVVTYHAHFRKESSFSHAGLYQTDSYIQLARFNRPEKEENKCL